jgi:DNA mismatch repair protein MutS
MINNDNFIKQTNKILNENEKELLTSKYFQIQKNAENIYGYNTVVFIEIGSFYEIYESKTIGKATEISKELNIFLTKKSKKIKEITDNNPLMCGVPSIMIDKHIESLIEKKKWTIVVIKQKKIENQNTKNPIIKRYVDNVISQGININYNTDDDYNFVASLILKKEKSIYYSAIALIDVSIGETIVFEEFGNQNDNKLAIDEIQNLLNKYKTKEIIIYKDKNIKNEEFDEIKSELEINKMNYIISKNDLNNMSINYQMEILKEAYKINSSLSIIEELELERLPLATVALANLILFIVEHNPTIIKGLKKPEIVTSSNKLYIGNNALKQLNIIDEYENSIERIINKAKTAIGRRYVKSILLSPIKDKNEIEQRYKISEDFINQNNSFKQTIINYMNNIYDIERLLRLLELKKITTKEFYSLYISIKNISLIYENFLLNKKYNDLFNKNNENIKLLLNDIEIIFDIEQLQYFNGNKEDKTFINTKNKTETNQNLINYIKEKSNKRKELENQINIFLSQYQNKEVSVIIKYTEKEGYYLEITKTKYKELEKSKKISEENNEYKIRKLTNSVKITSNTISKLSDDLFILQDKIIKETLYIFNEEMNKIKEKKQLIKKIIKDIQLIDFLIVNNYLHKKEYIKPEIVEIEKKEDTFIDIEELRHPIVEEEEKGIYVPNDIMLGTSKYFNNKKIQKELKLTNDRINGVMLHGLNASGKSTLIKSIGVSIILAQSGFFVPAKSFRFSIFDSLFTRISGSDDIYKGLSTFTIEMLEMKNIFNRATSNSLILGDELSHGTETQSAIAIVASGFLTLQKRNSLFFFATHLHQLNQLKSIKENKALIPLHLHVEHDTKNNKFIFDRKLKYGQGLSTYGLEYANYLNLDKEFIKTAYEIRREVSKEQNELELLLKNKKSNYNKSLYMTKCELCDNQADETHHINHQKNENENKNIKHFHKNNKGNLVNLCSLHHKLLHNTKCKETKEEDLIKWIHTSQGMKLWISPCLVKEMKINLEENNNLISY